MGTLITGETVHESHEWRQDVYGKSLYLLSNFAVDLTFSKISSFFKKKKENLSIYYTLPIRPVTLTKTVNRFM